MQARGEAIEFRQALATTDVEVPETDAQLLEGLTDAAPRLRTRGKLGIFAVVPLTLPGGARSRRPMLAE